MDAFVYGDIRPEADTLGRYLYHVLSGNLDSCVSLAGVHDTLDGSIRVKMRPRTRGPMKPQTLLAKIWFVDGGYDEVPVAASEYRRLKASGLADKRLIVELLSDDWGAPPSIVEIDGDKHAYG
jgi:hypothetical protein